MAQSVASLRDDEKRRNVATTAPAGVTDGQIRNAIRKAKAENEGAGVKAIVKLLKPLYPTVDSKIVREAFAEIQKESSSMAEEDRPTPTSEREVAPTGAYDDLLTKGTAMTSLKKAEAAFLKATTMLPDRPEAWLNLGTVYQNKKQPEQAFVMFNKAMGLAHDGSELWAAAASESFLTFALRLQISIDPQPDESAPPSWWTDESILSMTSRAVEIAGEQKAIVWEARAFALSAAHGRWKAALRTPTQIREAAKCIRRCARIDRSRACLLVLATQWCSAADDAEATAAAADPPHPAFLALNPNNVADQVAGFKHAELPEDAILEKYTSDRENEQERIAQSGERPTMCTFCARLTLCKRCERCSLVEYCSVECQKADYPRHKATCLAQSARSDMLDDAAKACEDIMTTLVASTTRAI